MRSIIDKNAKNWTLYVSIYGFKKTKLNDEVQHNKLFLFRNGTETVLF